MEIAFWRKIEKVPQNAEKSTLPDTQFVKAYIYMIFSIFLKPFMVDEVKVIFFQFRREFLSSSACQALQALGRENGQKSKNALFSLEITYK